ncbi:hypothetical protein BDK51DRAFT_47193 [Blyttiomyces helicus]|uniref:PH domain-containing protein n=1 Tax=Blyttiomyces helicus TaxID=388810 RepID=A0A4P9W220_9FUNG|nr:hypothetical protein BDK51DRAFT_47193 [Blyttiomyces helicus]|eukprot:RKO86164.1 hypothetical protein BDK51DRAFT_47193 [Blyttiomyces helicus]
MLSPTAHPTRPIKQGWVLKRGGNRLLAQWRPKYLVLTDTYLQIHDQNDPSRPPKHLVRIADAVIECGDGSGKGGGGRGGGAPFVVHAKDRKFYFAANTRGDRDDWLLHLDPNLVPSPPGSTLLPSPPSRASSPPRLHRRGNTISGPPPSSRGGGGLVSHHVRPGRPASEYGGDNGYADEMAPPRRTARYRSASARRREDDAASVCSEFVDDAASVVSSVVSVERGGVRRGGGGGGGSVASSRFDTLSFCSEPVLTPQELAIMGESAGPDASPAPAAGFVPSASAARARRSLERSIPKPASQQL